MLLEEYFLVCELNTQCILIQFLIKAIAQLTVNFHRGTNDALSQFLVKCIATHNLRNLCNLWLITRLYPYPPL